jgi:cysteine desulfurase/selenocysteine lyase
MPLSNDEFIALRRDFPMLSKRMHGKPLTYLDSAATAQKPFAVIEKMRAFYADHYGTVHRAVYDLAVEATEAYQAARVKAQKFLDAVKMSEIIFTRGTTESINLVASSFGKAFVEQGDEILITEMEHHSNIVPWQMLCEERGAILKVVPFSDKGELDLNAYKALLNRRTKLVAVTHVSNVLGTINPIREMAHLAHAAGAHILVDGAQAAPHLKVSVQELDVDFYVFSGHKLYGPTGVGVLYGKEALLNEMPPYQGGGDMIQEVHFEKTTYNPPPMKFEAGTPSIAEVIALAEAIDYLQAIGMEKIHDRMNDLIHYAMDRMREIPGMKFIGESRERSGIVTFVIEGTHPLDIGTLLDLKGFAIRTGHLCAQPTMRHFGIGAAARVSLGIYTTFEEIDKFVDELKVVRGELCD